jgi:magnesium chelatase subunit D
LAEPADAQGYDRDTDAVRAAACLAIDPRGMGGAVLQADGGEASERWLELLRRLLPEAEPLRRVPAHIEEERLFGGADLTATLQAGRAIVARGVLAETDGGVIVLSMAERLTASMAASIGNAIDRGAIRDGAATRFGLIALDCGREGDAPCAPALRDRLAIHLDLRDLMLPTQFAALPDRQAIQACRDRLALIASPEPALRALCATAAACGIESLRAPWLALQVARAHAALEARAQIENQDLQFAARVVLAPRARRDPSAQSEPASVSPPPPPPPEPGSEQGAAEAPADAGAQAQPPRAQAADSAPSESEPLPSEAALDEQILQAARAAIPAGLLAQMSSSQRSPRQSMAAGRAGASVLARSRGRPAGVRLGRPRQGTRLNILATLRAAAPWQKLRRAAAPEPVTRVRVCVSDFRVTWYRQRTQTVTIFVLDASGSSALHRLAEAKGAVELLLAECYVRRDQVAVVVFRGKSAELALAPTRSLLRAKRSLGNMPGGGATPLAAGLNAASLLVEQVRKRGQAPSLVVLTDGHANVAVDGTGGRQRGEADALRAARALRNVGVKTLLIDTAPRPQQLARGLAEAMQGRYLPLPNAEAHSLAAAVQHAR